MNNVLGTRRKYYLVVLSNLTDEIAERLVDIDTLLSRCLDELAAEMLGKITTLWS
jgi:hypothetical protein